MIVDKKGWTRINILMISIEIFTINLQMNMIYFIYILIILLETL